MSETVSIDVRCLHCRSWFPSPIVLGDSKTFDSSTLFNNLTRCPHCRQWTGCDKENFRVRFEDGGHVGERV